MIFTATLLCVFSLMLPVSELAEDLNHPESVQIIASNVSQNKDVRDSISDYLPKSKQIYKKVDYVHLRWGLKSDEICFIRKLPGYDAGPDGSVMHGGPIAFDIANNGDVIIFDNNSGHVKIFDKYSNLVNYFPVDKVANKGYLCYDNDIIYLHYPQRYLIIKYSLHGKIVANIKYNKMMTSEMKIIDNSIYVWGGKIRIDGENKQTDLFGGKEYTATIVDTPKSVPALFNYCMFSKKIVNTIPGRSIYYHPRIEVVERDGNEKVIVFEEIGTIYHLLFGGEDIQENIYFWLFHHNYIKPMTVFKCDKNFTPLSIIETPDTAENFIYQKRIVLKKNGDIYIMVLNESGVYIYKYML